MWGGQRPGVDLKNLLPKITTLAFSFMFLSCNDGFYANPEMNAQNRNQPVGAIYPVNPPPNYGWPSYPRPPTAPTNPITPVVPTNPTSNDAELRTAIVLNSAADVAVWPVTARITELDIQASGFSVEFTRKYDPGSWPDIVPTGWTGAVQYTMWILQNINGQWYTSGGNVYWRGLDRIGGEPSGIADHWFYDPVRWAPLSSHQPAVGERVGFFVTSGMARNVTDGSQSIRERSNVVWVNLPSDSGQTFRF